MKKEVLAVFLVVLLGLVPFSSAQLNFIEIKDVNVNENSLQVLVQNNVNQDFIKETVREKIFEEETISKDELILVKKLIEVTEKENLFGSEKELFKKLKER